jgi:lipid-A-disaccharide synthase
MPRRIFITAAELSGDQHAAQLVRSLHALDPTLAIEGHGGPNLASAGAALHHETTRRAAMGRQSLSRIVEMWKLLQWTKRYFDHDKPDLLICVDSPAMNFHFAKAAHARGIPVLYYIAPQTWAWREGRLKKIRRWIDHVACILPFEEPYFRRHGIPATFVGHPLFDHLPPQRGPAPGPRFPDRPPVIGLLPGSRRSEALANFPHLLDVAQQIREVFPAVHYLVPTTPATHPTVEQLAAGFSNLDYAADRFDDMVPRCDLCLTVSGTATLHVAAYGVPMLIVYRGSPFLWHLLGRWVFKTHTFGLVNLLANSKNHIAPEYVPWYGSNRRLAQHALEFLHHPEKLLAQQQNLSAMVQKLDHPGASHNAARIALDMLHNTVARATSPW